MHKLGLTENDYDLIKAAHDAFINIDSHWHGVASALRLKSGEIFTGVVMEAENPSLTVCAEPFAIEKTLPYLKNDPVECIVAVRFRETSNPEKVIPPCGRCREFITDYAPNADVIIYDENDKGLWKIAANDLLPFKYKAEP